MGTQGQAMGIKSPMSVQDLVQEIMTSAANDRPVKIESTDHEGAYTFFNPKQFSVYSVIPYSESNIAIAPANAIRNIKNEQ